MSKQTATQYLIEEIKNDSFVQAKSSEEWNEVFRIAKEMEREQIVDAYNSARNDHHQMYFADEYFNKTYGEKFGEKFGGKDE